MIDPPVKSFYKLDSLLRFSTLVSPKLLKGGSVVGFRKQLEVPEQPYTGIGEKPPSQPVGEPS